MIALIVGVALVFILAACSDDPGGDDLPSAQVSQPPTSEESAGSVGVYTNGTSLVIKGGTLVYQAPDSGVLADAVLYSGSDKEIEFYVNHSSGVSATLSASGYLEVVTIPVPPNSYLEPASSFFDGDGVPAGSLKTGADVLIGELKARECGLGDFFLSICATNTVFEDGWPSIGEEYIYYYSKGDVTLQVPRTQIEPGFYGAINVQLKAGWNCVAWTWDGTTETLVSKNPPSTVRWAIMEK